MITPAPTVPEIDVVAAFRHAASGTALLLDVREPAEWAQGRAACAVNAPLSTLRPEQVPRDRPVMTLCRGGARSARAAVALAAAGHEVLNVSGGMLAWSESGLGLIGLDGAEGLVA